MSELELRICSLYPESMNIYADRGNIAVLERRCQWRQIALVHRRVTFGETIDPDWADLYYIGGGQDRDQKRVATDLVTYKRAGLLSALDADAVVLAVCGGYQLLGHGYQLADELIEGLGLADLETVREPGPRLVGNVAIETSLDGLSVRLAGFENHGGRTYLGKGVTPLGTVIEGFGNNGKDRTEGVRVKNLFGTYLHGPLLPKNVEFADYLVELALRRRGGDVSLVRLEDDLERLAHADAVRAAGT